MTKIYTKTGDKGKTSLVGGQRVSKCHPRIEAYGTLDELNSYIGLLRAEVPEKLNQDDLLSNIQHRLFTCGAYMATDNSKPGGFSVESGITDSDIARIEEMIDSLQKELPAMKAFVLPAGARATAVSHICRTVARRAERAIYRFLEEDTEGNTVEENVLRYINRLSDYFFVLARAITHHLGQPEVVWQKEG